MKTATTHPSDPLGLAFSRAERLFPGYEQRPQQQQMAQSIRETLASRGSLLIEAPTGVGKSIGYLLPSILEAIEHQRKAVISTHTKNLQEQLLLRDIPLASRLLDCHCSAIALKGRHNYLCPTRLDAAISAKSGMFGPSTLDALEDLARWSTSTSSGDLEEYPEKLTNEVRELVASEQGVCNPRACRGRCFFQRSREAARAASVVILNHALFFQMLSKGDDEDRLVYENDFVVFDEAHTLERVASSSLGIRLMRGAALRPLTRMLHQVQGRALFGRRVRSAQKHVRTALEAIEDLFDELVRESARGVKGKASREIRVREPDLVEDRVTSPMRTVIDLIQDAASDLPMLPGLEVTPLVTSLESTITAISTFLHQEEPESAYWIESGESPTNVTLCVSPLNVADILRTRLFRPGVSIVMTSATLAVNNSATFFQRRIGATEAPFLQLDTPFNFSTQMRVTLAPDVPEPDSPFYREQLAQRILQAVDRTHGRSLVLFTNTVVMRACATAVESRMSERGYTLLVQGISGTRQELLEQFRADVSSVLFGLESFWTGIDVPGESLQHVIITRLPFAVPGHPFVEAKLEQIAARGGNGFAEYSLPDAVLRFRQGVGRLVRSASDTGIVTVLDSRILRKSYGRVFLQGIPRCPVEIWSADGTLEEIDEGT